jgi:hypothetical protein
MPDWVARLDGDVSDLHVQRAIPHDACHPQFGFNALYFQLILDVHKSLNSVSHHACAAQQTACTIAMHAAGEASRAKVGRDAAHRFRTVTAR